MPPESAYKTKAESERRSCRHLADTRSHDRHTRVLASANKERRRETTMANLAIETKAAKMLWRMTAAVPMGELVEKPEGQGDTMQASADRTQWQLRSSFDVLHGTDVAEDWRTTSNGYACEVCSRAGGYGSLRALKSVALDVTAAFVNRRRAVQMELFRIVSNVKVLPRWPLRGRFGQYILMVVVLLAPMHRSTATLPFLDDDEVRDTLVGHSLRGKKWIEYYSANGELVGKVRYFGLRDYRGRWSVSRGRVCYDYGDPRVNTCSWLRHRGETVTHHLEDGSLKPDGEAQRLVGNRLADF